MKHAYIVHLYYGRMYFNMPYLFTSEKEAYAYGEFVFRTEYDITGYEVEKIRKLHSKFYRLK